MRKFARSIGSEAQSHGKQGLQVRVLRPSTEYALTRLARSWTAFVVGLAVLEAAGPVWSNSHPHDTCQFGFTARLAKNETTQNCLRYFFEAKVTRSTEINCVHLFTLFFLYNPHRRGIQLYNCMQSKIQKQSHLHSLLCVFTSLTHSFSLFSLPTENIAWWCIQVVFVVMWFLVLDPSLIHKIHTITVSQSHFLFFSNPHSPVLWMSIRRDSLTRG